MATGHGLCNYHNQLHVTGHLLPPPSHNALLSESDLGGAQREPATAPLMRRLMSVRELGHDGDGEDHQVAALLRRVGEDLVDGEWNQQLLKGQSEVRGHLQDGAILVLSLLLQY